MARGREPQPFRHHVVAVQCQGGRSPESPFYAACGIDSYSLPRFHTAHAIRASLLARGYGGLVVRFSSARAQVRSRSWRSAFLAWHSTDRAPWISSMRRYESPRFEMRPSRLRRPLEYSRGVRPR
jgi:hypothetical protein